MASKILSAFIIGAAAGAALGVLFSPDKGSETRRKISESSKDIIDQLSQKIDEGKEALTNLKNKITSVAEKAEKAAYTVSNGNHGSEASTARSSKA